MTTDTDSIRKIVKGSREQLAGKRGPEKEIAVMIGALTEAVLLLVESRQPMDLSHLSTSGGRRVYDVEVTQELPCREEIG